MGATLLLAAGLALALAGGLTACGGSAGGDPSPAPAETAPQAAVPAEPPAPDASTPTARVTPAPQAETPEPPTPTAAAPITEPPAEPVAPVAPEVDPPPDEPASTAPAASEPPPAPGEPPTGDPSTATDEAEPLPLLYDTYDLSGTVAEPGHYVFLADPADTGTAVTTYEGLRDGTATALLIHTHDTHGISQAARYDAVEPGDLVEWKQADDCFVRYTVTSAPAPAAGATARAFGVAWMTYAFTGCSGAISTAATAVSVTWGAVLPALGGTSLTAPVRHGSFQIVPEGWTGATEAPQYSDLPPAQNPYEAVRATTAAAARQLPYWRTPTLPEGWTFAGAVQTSEINLYGYRAYYRSPQGGIGLEITASHLGSSGWVREAAQRPNAGANLTVTETRVIAGRPAQVFYSPPGPTSDPRGHTLLWVYDPATQSIYELYGLNTSLSGSNIDALIAIARSLFENPPRLLYDTYDLSGTVAEPGHYVFLADPADTGTAVTTYEGLRDGTATALLIHTHDTHGISQAARYDAVEPGDLVEWKQADDCFVRYTVTSAPAPAAGATARAFGVALDDLRLHRLQRGRSAPPPPP